MKVLIIGGGTVGMASAKSALAGNDVHIIEKDANLADTIRNILPVSVLKGDASNPNVLNGALDRIEPDFMISAVSDDGTNLFVCDTAKRHRPGMRTVACIRNPEFLATDGYEGVDVLVSPDVITSEKMIKMSLLENAVNYERLDIEGYSLTTFRIEQGHDIVGRTVMNTALPEGCTIVCIYRGNRAITRVSTTEVHAGDRIIVLGTDESITRFNELVGIKKEAREFVVLGASYQGLSIANEIAGADKKNFVKILDDDLDRCREASKLVRKAIVVNGNIVDPQFLHSESVERADALISVTEIDERNLLACMTAMRFGISKIVSRYSIEEYEGVFKYAGIESVIGWHKIIANEVTKILRTKEGSSVHVMETQGDFFITFVLEKGSPMTGRFYGDLVIPEDVNVCGYLRSGKVVFPDLLTKFEEGDEVMIYAHRIEPLKLTGLLGSDVPEF